MRALPFAVALVAASIPAFAQQQQPASAEIVDRIVAQEQTEVQSLRQYSPIVETYIQLLRPDKDLAAPNGDKYFLGRADLANGIELEPLVAGTHAKRKMLDSLGGFFSVQFLPRGFLQMIYVDTTGFDRAHYRFNYVGREFLGDVRCLVFDLDPISKKERGRFVGRIWVEDQDFHIVRFNGGYAGGSKTSYYFSFDSWRTNAGKNEWLPSFIYSEETDNAAVQSFRAQTRLWSYAPATLREEQELSQVLVETVKPVKDTGGSDYSPIEEKRAWGRQAEDNVAAKMEQLGLMAPAGDVDKVLDTVVNNLEVTNNLDVQPDVRCRVLMTSTLESFSMGHTIVLSRGLVDVLPDEASLAAVLAHELGHVLLGHRMGTQFAFFNRLRFDEKETFHHFGFVHTPDEERAAAQKGMALLQNSPYKEHLESAQLFFQALNNRAKAIPNLVSPHLGNRVAMEVTATAAPAQASAGKSAAKITALPLGGRIRIEPWDNQLRMLKAQPVGAVAQNEVSPFELTPFVLYLSRKGSGAANEPRGAVSMKATAAASIPDVKP